ncbi:SCO6745 family protein [Mycobacterium persicum]
MASSELPLWVQVSPPEGPDWPAITARNARSVQTVVGWIFWDPGAVARYEALGLPDYLATGLGYQAAGYLAARAAPLAPAGPEAVIAAFGSISPLALRVLFPAVAQSGRSFVDFWRARDEAVVEGLHSYVPDIMAPLEELGPRLWPVVEALPRMGRAFFAAHLDMPRPDDPLLSGWHAVNCLREWRGDTHWAVLTAAGLTHAEASILHNAWLGYEKDWLGLSRGTSADDLSAGWERLRAKGLAAEDTVLQPGLDLREAVERRTDELTTQPWQMLGEAAAILFAEQFEPPCELLLKRVDETAGPNYQPASRQRRYWSS